MRALLCPLLAALAFVAAPAAAQAQGSPRAVPLKATPEALTLAAELSRITNDQAEVLAMLDVALDGSLPKALAADSTFQELEKLYPGIGAEFIGVMKPIIREYLIQEWPEYQRRSAEIYAKWLTPADLRVAIAFYSSPTGLKLRAAVAEGADFTELFSEQIASLGEAEITAKDLEKSLDPAIDKAASSLTPAERLEVMRFVRKVGPQKLARSNAEIMQMAAGWSSEMDPETEQKIEEAVLAMMARRMSGEKPQ
ncbi:DUF2059 domain-containing protein [Sphingomonas canadensis]